MVSDRAGWWQSGEDFWDYDDFPPESELRLAAPLLDGWVANNYGPPTELDDAWFTHHVASLNYPRGHRNPVIDGQLDLTTYLANEEWDADRE